MHLSMYTYVYCLQVTFNDKILWILTEPLKIPTLKVLHNFKLSQKYKEKIMLPSQLISTSVQLWLVKEVQYQCNGRERIGNCIVKGQDLDR